MEWIRTNAKCGQFHCDGTICAEVKTTFPPGAPFGGASRDLKQERVELFCETCGTSFHHVRGRPNLRAEVLAAHTQSAATNGLGPEQPPVMPPFPPLAPRNERQTVTKIVSSARKQEPGTRTAVEEAIEAAKSKGQWEPHSPEC